MLANSPAEFRLASRESLGVGWHALQAAFRLISLVNALRAGPRPTFLGLGLASNELCAAQDLVSHKIREKRL